MTVLDSVPLASAPPFAPPFAPFESGLVFAVFAAALVFAVFAVFALVFALLHIRVGAGRIGYRRILIAQGGAAILICPG